MTCGGEVGELRERMAHLEGLLEGLREAITGWIAARRMASTDFGMSLM